MRRTFGIMVLSSILGVALPSRAPAVPRSLGYSSNPTEIQGEIAVRGPRAVVSELYDHLADWEHVMRGIRSGDTEWLRVAVALHPGSDAGHSEMLAESVGIALIRAPETVLRLAIPAFDLEDVCGGRQDPLPTFVEASAELEAQITSVARVKSTRVRDARDRCLEKLKQGRANLKLFFDAK